MTHLIVNYETMLDPKEVKFVEVVRLKKSRVSAFV